MACPEGLEIFTQTLHKKLRKDCAYCHGGQGPGPGHSVSDVKASYKMVKDLLALSDPPSLTELSSSKFITTGGNNHCASYGVECNTTSEELLSLVRPWISEEIKSCRQEISKYETNTVNLFAPENFLKLSVAGHKDIRVEMSLEAHKKDAQGSGYVKIKNLKICHPNAKVIVKGLKIWVDGEDDIYASFDEHAFEPCQSEFQPETLLFAAQKKPITTNSNLKISFSDIEVMLLAPPPELCRYQAYYERLVKPFMQASCIECHSSVKTPLKEFTCNEVKSYTHFSSIDRWNVFLRGSRYHPILPSTQGLELLQKYLELENEKGDTSFLAKLSRSFLQIFQFETMLNESKSNLMQLVARGSGTCVVNQMNGVLSCWGQSNSLNSDKKVVRADAQEAHIMTLGPVKQVATNGSNVCAILYGDDSIDGQLQCWGRNYTGQLGYGDTNDRKVPDGLISFENTENSSFVIKSLNSFKSFFSRKLKVRQVAMGDTHVCVLLENGRLRCWGEANGGILGYGNQTQRHQPQEDVLLAEKVKEISVNSKVSCALLVDGHLQCWGNNFSGQLGYGDKEARSKPDGFVPTAMEVKHVEVGSSSVCAILVNGKLQCWGNGYANQLGYNDRGTDRYKPMGYVPLAGSVKQISIGSGHACAILEGGDVDGKLQCWGRNEFGKLGIQSKDSGNFLPQMVPLPRKVLQVSLGSNHTCVVLEGNELQCWGYNRFGQLGFGDLQNRNGFESGHEVPYMPLMDYFNL